MDSVGSIFDQAGKEFRKKSPQTSQPQESPSPTLTPGSPKPSPKIQAKITDEELNTLFEAVYKLNDEVAKKLDYAHNWLGISHKEIKNFLENPNNFKDNTQWLKVQQSRSNMLGRLERDIIYQGKEPPQSVKDKNAKLEKKKKDETADKTRKGKTLGSRKGWMPM